MTFFKTIPEEEPSQNFKEYKIDDKVFYYIEKEKINLTPSKRRYSDQFKDPLFISKDTNRKLNMIMKFNEKYKNINKLTDKCIQCIEECILILKKEYMVDPLTIFESFDLEKVGINPEDFGVILKRYDEE